MQIFIIFIKYYNPCIIYMTSNNISQLLFNIILDGDVTGEIPIYNYNFNYLNKNLNQNGNIYIPNNINLNKVNFKDKKYKNNKEKEKEYRDKKKKLFNSKDEINNLLKAINDDSKIYQGTSSFSDISKNIQYNINYIINLFFNKNDYFYIDNKKFIITDNNHNFKKTISYDKISKDKILKFKNCSSDLSEDKPCNKDNLLNAYIENQKKKKLEFLNKIDSSDISKNINRVNDEIRKEIQSDIDNKLKNFANTIIQKIENKKNDYLKAGIKYIYKDKSSDKNIGIYLEIKNEILENIKIKLTLREEKYFKKDKIYIEKGDCKTRKKYIINLWKKMTKKNNNNESKKIWKYNYKTNKLE